jgi:hypothetical protein
LRRFKVWEHPLRTKTVLRQYPLFFKVKIYSGTDNFQTTSRQLERYPDNFQTTWKIYIIYPFFWRGLVCFEAKKKTLEKKSGFLHFKLLPHHQRERILLPIY